VTLGQPYGVRSASSQHQTDRLKGLVFRSAHPNRGFTQRNERVKSAYGLDLAEVFSGHERIDERLGRRRALERTDIDSQHGPRSAR
jgi:hypothetical protein